jgi:ankyrin repeat protein
MTMRSPPTLPVAVLVAFVLTPALADPLHDAAEQGEIGQVKRLIDQDADVNARDDYDLTPLHFSVGAGHIKIVELLIAEGANVNARHQMGTPLHPAASTSCT